MELSVPVKHANTIKRIIQKENAMDAVIVEIRKIRSDALFLEFKF